MSRFLIAMFVGATIAAAASTSASALHGQKSQRSSPQYFPASTAASDDSCASVVSVCDFARAEGTSSAHSDWTKAFVPAVSRFSTCEIKLMVRNGGFLAHRSPQGATMRQKSNSTPASSETLVRNIRRVTRKHHAAEEKIRKVFDGLRGETSWAISFWAAPPSVR